MKIVMTPMKRMGHCVQRQPFAWAAKPPTAGPRAGPKNGLSKNIEDAAAREMGAKTSEFVPAPTARQPEPSMPAKKRQTIKVLKFFARPAPKVKRRDGVNIVR